MKTIEVELPDRVTVELETLVKDGWFADEAEVIRVALLEFVQRNRLALMERFQIGHLPLRAAQSTLVDRTRAAAPLFPLSVY